MNTYSHAQALKHVDAHFAARISPEGERELRLHLVECRACRSYYDRHLLLAELDPSAKRAEERLAVGLGLGAPAKRARSMALGWAAAMAAAALALVVLPLRYWRSDEFVARGLAPATAEPQVLVYQVPAGQRPRAPKSTIRRSDELAFAYANSPGYRRLMIFGVDEHRHIYWYHPAWSDAALDPHGIEIAPGGDVREIPEAISHSIDGRELTVFAIFTNEDLSVRKIEDMVRAAGSLAEPLPIRASFQKRLRYDVER
jgi:hypothetical protein